MGKYRSAIVGCSRIGGFIDNEVRGSHVVLPYSHAAGYTACENTDLIACSDLRTDVMLEFGRQYNIEQGKQYTDYKKMIDIEKPDILSVATQPEIRSEIILYALSKGVSAIYAEKPLAASMKQAQEIFNAVEKNQAVFNLGTNRRWDNGFNILKNLISNGDLGEIKSITVFGGGGLFNSSSHWIDLIMYLNSDNKVLSVQGDVPGVADMIHNNILSDDPEGFGILHFSNGVKGYYCSSGVHHEVKVVGDKGVVNVLNNGLTWVLDPVPYDESNVNSGYSNSFPKFAQESSTLKLIEDIVSQLDGRQETQGGIRAARDATEVIFALIQSELTNGSKINFPLEGSEIILRRNISARKPKYS
ncbi:MAG: Gfo/Idh/MocA family protein [Dehalococcoidia bacterium]